MHWNQNSVILILLLQCHKVSDTLTVRVWSYKAGVIDTNQVRLKLESNSWSKNSDSVREVVGVMMWDSKRLGEKNQHSSLCQCSVTHTVKKCFQMLSWNLVFQILHWNKLFIIWSFKLLVYLPTSFFLVFLLLFICSLPSSNMSMFDAFSLFPGYFCLQLYLNAKST